MQFRRSAISIVLAAAAALAQQKASAPPAQPSAAASQSALSQEQIRALIRLSADNDLENDKKQRDYTYVERRVERRLDGKSNVKSTETKTYDVMEIYGEPVEKLIAKDDKPLSAKDAQKEDEKIQKLIDKRKNESDSDREKRLKKEEKDRQDKLQFVGEVADAYNFKFVGVETLDGRDNYVIDGEPKPGYQPVHKDAKILTKTRFRAWIDKDDSQLKKLDVEFIDDVSFGLFLFRLRKGAHAIIETTRVNDEVWLQRHVLVSADVRVALLKNFDVAMDITDRDYKKFRTDTKIVPVGELQTNH
jgi:hypothetical protein